MFSFQETLTYTHTKENNGLDAKIYNNNRKYSRLPKPIQNFGLFGGQVISYGEMVKVYSTPTCPYCVTLKAFLRENAIEFEDIDVSRDDKALQDMVKNSGQMGVPVVDIDGKIVVGFDKQKICELLKIK